jgi:hypothetical protein
MTSTFDRERNRCPRAKSVQIAADYKIFSFGVLLLRCVTGGDKEQRCAPAGFHTTFSPADPVRIDHHREVHIKMQFERGT